MKIIISKNFAYPILILTLFTLLCSIIHLKTSFLKKYNKLEELRKTEERLANKDKENEQIIANIYYDEKKINFNIIESVIPDKDAVAYALYNKSYQRTGWDYLAISSYEKNDNKYNDSLKAYAMGYIEGYLTNETITQNFFNLFHVHIGEYQMEDNLKDFLQKNTEYMKQKAEKKMKYDRYWEHVYYIYRQLLGLYDGYIAAVGRNITGFYEFILLNSESDSSDIMTLNSKEFPYDFKNMNIEEIKNYIMLKSHCSALIKLAKDFSDIWVGHNTWYTYESMLRIFKEYRFVTKNGYEKSKTTAFSSYPGFLVSTDDFYLLDSNLVVMETSNPLYNNSLYEKIKPESLFTWVRTILSNRLASSAEDWTEIFNEENSGTYNNQFMILDLNKIDLKNRKIPDKSLMVIEQIPEEFEINDVTEYLRKGYWPSYNVPFSKYIYEKSGIIEIIKEHPKLIYDLDYNNCSRAQIFKRDQNKINSNYDFERMLRYNDFQNDNLSFNASDLTIAARYDLNNKSSCYGTIDAKYVSTKELFEGKSLIHIISGPTNDQQPTFSWANTTCKSSETKFEGLIEIWNKDWVDYKTQLFEIKKKDDDSKENKTNNDIVIIILSSACGLLFIVLLIFIILYLRNTRKHSNLNVSEGQIGLIDN